MREQDREVVGQFRSLGIGPGLTFDAEALTAAQRRGLKRAAETAFARVPMHGQENGRMRNGWRFANNLGGDGDDRILASTIGLMGYGANIAEEAPAAGAAGSGDAVHAGIRGGTALPPNDSAKR